MRYHLRNIFYGRLTDATMLQFLLDSAVFKVKVWRKRQVELYAGDDILLFQFVFKYTFAIAEAAFFFGKRFHFTRGYLKRTAGLKYILQLYPVSANVLYRRCTHRTRN